MTRLHAILFVTAAFAATLGCYTLMMHINSNHQQLQHRRRLSELESSSSDDHWTWDIPSILSRAKKKSSLSTQQPLRVLIITTSLVEYDKGTRGTTHGFDRLQHVVLPPLIDSVKSMTSHGWHVDVYLILGYKNLAPHRKQLIIDALPPGVGLEVWEDAIPLYYKNNFNKKRPRSDQAISNGDHALSRQHRFVLRDKLPYYDFFVAFEDDMRITADHVLEFLELSNDIYQLYKEAMSSSNGQEVAVVDNNVEQLPPTVVNRHKSNDGASVGNDIIHDPINVKHIQRLFPGLLRVEVLDRKSDHPLRKKGVLDNHRFVKECPPSSEAFRYNNEGGGESLLDPTICCDEHDPPRGKMTAHPTMEEVVMWETNIHATGVRKYPDPIGWVAAMPVEDRADVGSFWSGYKKEEPNLKRPRRVDETIGNQAGFMATRSQIEYFHNTACPGGFLPPFDSKHWKGDSLQRHSVEFWSGGFQLFGQCYLNRILPLEPRRFEKHLIYHVSNNKQRTAPAKKMIRVGDFYGQIITVKERAKKFAKEMWSTELT